MSVSSGRNNWSICSLIRVSEEAASRVKRNFAKRYLQKILRGLDF